MDQPARQHRGGYSVNSATGGLKRVDLIPRCRSRRGPCAGSLLTATDMTRHRQCSHCEPARLRNCTSSNAEIDHIRYRSTSRSGRIEQVSQDAEHVLRLFYRPGTSAKVINKYHHQSILLDEDVVAFSNPVSPRALSDCDDATCLTRCHRAFVSRSPVVIFSERRYPSSPLATYPIVGGPRANPRSVTHGYQERQLNARRC